MAKTWASAARAAVFSGAAAGLTSMAALALRGRVNNGSALAPINAPSHVLWGDRALMKNMGSLRYTATGATIHLASALFWGLLHEKLWAPREPSDVAGAITAAAATSAVAALVNLAVVPKRLTPGFERRLSRRSLVWVYAALAIGLAAGSQLAGRRSARD